MYTPLEPTTVHSAYYFIMLDVLISLFMSNTGLKWFKLQWDVINSQIIRVTQLEGGGRTEFSPTPHSAYFAHFHTWPQHDHDWGPSFIKKIPTFFCALRALFLTKFLTIFSFSTQRMSVIFNVICYFNVYEYYKIPSLQVTRNLQTT